jgi:Tfp pilus assembly protein PilN
MNPLTPDLQGLPDDDAREELPFVPSPRPASSPAAALAAPPARVEPLNLARRPFLNSRPVVRASVLLWLLGVLLLLGNVSLFWTYRQRSATKREQITRGEAEIAGQQSASSKLQSQLDSFELETQNRRIDFLNKQIEERTFSWSELLDRVADRLPHDVRLNRLAPLTGQKAEKEFQRSHVARHASRASDQVSLLITGEARNDTELLTFVQSLFRAPFAEPDLTREERLEDGKTLKFEISVQYRPGPLAPAAAGTEGAAGAAGTATGSGAPRIEELPMPAAPPAAATAAPRRPTLHATPAPPQGGRP